MTSAWSANGKHASIGISTRSFRVVATPRLEVAHYRTRGVYPYVAGSGAAAINRGLRGAIIADERRYAVQASAVTARMTKAQLRSVMGLYATRVLPSFVAGNSRLVSVLLPVVRLYPGGNDGQGWIAVTLSVAHGQQVALRRILRTNPSALKRLSVLVRDALVRSNPCARNSLDDKALGAHFANGLAPKISNYSRFAVTPTGIAFGFEVNRIAGAVCGRVSATVRFSQLLPLVTTSGRQLIERVHMLTLQP